MTELSETTLGLIYQSMQIATDDFKFLVDEDNRKLLKKATEELEKCAFSADCAELEEAFAGLRQQYLDLCPNEEPHIWKIDSPVWSKSKGYYVYKGRCTRCGETCNQEDIPLWNPAVKDEEDE